MRNNNLTGVVSILLLSFLVAGILLGSSVPRASADPSSLPWAPTTNYPIAVSGQSCVVSSGYVYCIGGLIPSMNSNTTNAVYYAPLSASGVGTWTQATSYPTDIAYQSCVSDSGYVYCIGGDVAGTGGGHLVYYVPALFRRRGYMDSHDQLSDRRAGAELCGQLRLRILRWRRWQ